VKLRLLVIIFAIFVISVASFAFWFSSSLEAVNPSFTAESEFIISPNQTASEIVNGLYIAHLIKSPKAAKLYLRLVEMDSRLLPGSYLVSASKNTPDLLKSLTRGPKDLWVTIPEGWRREQIAARLQKTLGEDSNFNPQDFVFQTATLEGHLFPDTYLIPASSDSLAIIKIITDNFNTKVGKISYEDLIIASLVEREAKLAPDRPVIAGIFKKRLKESWPLQVDATVQYTESTTRCKKELSCDGWIPPTDTTLASPYNTYLNPGLPPSPIANPGLASIESVLHSQDSTYWYYLTDEKGVTHFAATLSQHNLNIDKYLRP
jgi:UPF0755 protein